MPRNFEMIRRLQGADIAKTLYDKAARPTPIWSHQRSCLIAFGISIVVLLEFSSTPYQALASGDSVTVGRQDPGTNSVIYQAQQGLRKGQGSLYHRSLSDTELEGAVGRAAFEHRLSPALLLAVMKAESSFNPAVVSKAGAVGLMQLIPETAIRHGVRNLYDTDENVAGGAKHLRYLLDRFHGKLSLALAAYNAGEGVVDRYGKVPPYRETSLYVKKVMRYYRDYKKGGWVLSDVSEPVVPRGRMF